jgi:hypothetical protein
MKYKSAINVSTIIALFTAVMFFSACQKDDLVTPASSPSEPMMKSAPPSVPALLEVPAGNEVSFHAYATGVQIYTCTETSPGVFAWVFTAPEATLYSNAAFNGGGTGIHYGGPTWESNSGSLVVGTRLQGVTVDPNAIPWLLLGAVSSQGPGVYEGTTYIQRTNTVGGKAPATGADASTVGQQAQVPYTAEYFFYKAAD